MKYIYVLADGAADWPIASLQNKTPLAAAKKPLWDALAAGGKVGLVKTLPEGFPVSSEVANLSVLGYPPQEFYTGRSSLEALCLKVPMAENDVTLRVNFVTFSAADRFEDRILEDYCGGEISVADGAAVIGDLAAALDSEILKLYAGLAFRNVLLWKDGPRQICYHQPHDIMGKRVGDFLPQGDGADLVIDYMERACQLLAAHPYNVARAQARLPQANGLWLWGPGTPPSLEPFQARYGLKGGVICGVDLIRGIGLAAGMDILHLHSATGDVVTDFRGKGEIAAAYLKGGGEFVFIHIEAPDEAGHQNKLDKKLAAVERIDGETIPALLRCLDEIGDDYRLMVSPDHATPLATRTHSAEPVPFLIFDSRHHRRGSHFCFSEESAKARGLFFDSGPALFKAFLDPNFY